MSNNGNLNKILKSNLGHRKLRYTRTFLDYLNLFQKDLFTTIKQFEPPNRFVTFVTSMNNYLKIL